MFLEKRRVSKSTDCHGVTLEFVADIRGTEAVANAGKFGCTCSVALFDSVDPFWDRFVGKRCVLALPRLIVKIWIPVVMAVLAMLPDWVLCNLISCGFILAQT